MLETMRLPFLLIGLMLSYAAWAGNPVTFTTLADMGG